MFRNLKAEMARKGITKLSLAKKLNMRYPTLVDKLNGKYPLHFEEAVRIKQVVCPEMGLDYLFETENQTA